MLLTVILMPNGILTDMYRILITILFGVLMPIYTFAGYDGRLVDDQYHTSPKWLYLFLVVGLFALIGKWAKSGTRKKNVAAQNHLNPLNQFITILLAIGQLARNAMESDM